MEDLYEKIEAYINGELPPDERKSFEEKLNSDSQLAEEVKLFSQVKDTIRRRLSLEKDEAEFLSLIQPNNEVKNFGSPLVKDFRRRNFWVLAIAAAIALILVVSFFSRKQEKNGPELYALYMGVPELPNVRNTESGDCQEGAIALKEKDYEGAVVALEKCLVDSSQGLDVKLALAYAYIAVDSKKARPYLEEIDSQRGVFLPVLKYKASWYLILMAVKIENWKKANALLNSFLNHQDLPKSQKENAEALKLEVAKKF